MGKHPFIEFSATKIILSFYAIQTDKRRPFQFVLANIIKPQINTDERRFSGSVSAFICGYFDSTNM